MNETALRIEPLAPVCCAPLGEGERLSPRDADDIATRLAALAEPGRIAIVSILAGRPGHALTTREIAPLVSLSEATVSHHLKRLADAGLLHKTREGARVFYNLDLTAMRAISAVLDVCCDCCAPGSALDEP